MEQKLRKTGIDIIGDAHWGTHFCQFYQTKEDLIDILVPYFKAGLENNEYCMWVTSEPLKLEEAKAALRKEVKNLDNYIKKGQIEILDYSQWYTKPGGFDVDKVLQGWIEKEKEASTRGFEGLRLTGNTFWLEKRDWKSFADYEAVVNSVIGKYRILAICSYSLDKCKAGEIIDVVSNHQFALIRRAGKWGIIESSERKRAEAKLKHAAEEWGTTFDSITDMVSIHDKDFKIVRVNKSFANVFNMKPSEIIGKTCYELIHGTKEPSPFCPHKRTLDTGKPKRGEFFEPRLGIHIEVSTSPLIDENEQIIASVHIAKDITERKQAEEEIRSLAKFPSENPNPVLRIQKSGKILYSNDATVPLLAKWKTKVGGAIPPKWRRLIDKAFESKKAINDEEEVDDKIFSFVVAPILDSGYANLYARDITEHRQAEEALRTNEAQLSNAMKIANLGYWEYDVADDQFTFNDHFYDIFHTTAKQVGGYTMKSARYAELFLHPDDRQVVAIETKKALETTDPQYNRQLEHRIVYATGEIGYISVRFVIVKDKQGRTIKTFGANQDITDRKRAEKKQEKTYEKLLETSRMAGMAEVAADVLHNVGNVLNSINVSTTVIREKVSNSEVANLEKVASIINEHTDDLGTFLTEHPQGKHIPVYLTEVSKCLQNEQTDIIDKLKVLTENVQHIKDIVSMQQSYAKVSGVEVQTSLSKLAEDAIQINIAGLERHGTRLIREFDELGDVEIDKQKVLQVLVNLISNAKYALSGSKREEKLLTIRIYKHGEDRFRIEVADNGVGISEDNLTKIFSHGFTTKEHGHGFGLHSCALASKEMGGSLTVHSEGLGQGATFTLELPFKPVEVMK
ncbi:Adaptive-response sensory-kinase SasA [subsurface metagenome]